MSITEHEINLKLNDYQEFKIGKLFLFENFIVAEFNEGVHINYENFEPCKNAIINFYKDQPFGFIAHRINSYSLNLSDADKWNEIFPHLKAYAVVCDRLFGKGIFEIENQFFTYNREIFKTLDDAIVWVQNTLNNKNNYLR